MTIYSDIAQVLCSQDAETAVNNLLSIYKHDVSKSHTMYGCWKIVRNLILRDDKNRDPDFGFHVSQWLAKTPELSEEDFERVSSFLQLSLKEQHRRHLHKSSILRNKIHNQEFLKIRPVFPAFYDFLLPTEFIKEKKSSTLQKKIDKQLHRDKPRSFYTFRFDKVNQILTKVLEVLETTNSIQSSTDYFNVFNAIQLVSGRRNTEIGKTLDYQPHPDHALQARVRGLLKNDEGGSEWITIPLLCRYEIFEEKMNMLRHYKPLGGIEIRQCDKKLSYGVARGAKRLFGMSLIHTQKRNLYGELAFMQRSINKFMYNENESCSKFVWVAKALGHVINYRNFSTTQLYQVINIEP